MSPERPAQTARQRRHRGTDYMAPLLFIGSGFSQYIGAGIAIGVFSYLSPFIVAWARVAIAGLILTLWRRPFRGRRWTRRELAATAFFGIVMTAMNMLFYGAIGLLPIGTAVSLEFCGPVAVAVLTGRGWRPRVAMLLAAAGVLSIGGLGINLADPKQLLGAALALAAGATWAGYIVTGQRIAARRSGIDSLAIGSLIGACVFLPVPLATFTSTPAWKIFMNEGVRVPLSSQWGPAHLPFGLPATALTLTITVVLVACLSTVLPYSLEQVAFARLHPAGFALLSALLPLTSTLVGAVMLLQLPNFGQWAGLVLISAAVALARGAKQHSSQQRIPKQGRSQPSSQQYEGGALPAPPTAPAE